MMPGMSGFEVLKCIRKSATTPVLMLTAKGEEVDRIVGLEMGADDYMQKPFNPRELVARIRAIIRRVDGDGSNQPEKIKTITIGDIVLFPGNRSVQQDGNDIGLTTMEFSLLYELVTHHGEVLSRDDLAEKVLSRKLSLFDRSIDVHIGNLRKKLGHFYNGHERIKSIRGVGYLYSISD